MTQYTILRSGYITVSIRSINIVKPKTVGSPQVYSLQACIHLVIVGSFVDVPLLLDLMVVWQAIHFVNEHLEVDVWVDCVGPGHREVQSIQSLHIVILSGRRKNIHTDNKCSYCILYHILYQWQLIRNTTFNYNNVLIVFVHFGIKINKHLYAKI